jgi:hypothetical protein
VKGSGDGESDQSREAEGRCPGPKEIAPIGARAVGTDCRSDRPGGRDRSTHRRARCCCSRFEPRSTSRWTAICDRCRTRDKRAQGSGGILTGNSLESPRFRVFAATHHTPGSGGSPPIHADREVIGSGTVDAKRDAEGEEHWSAIEKEQPETTNTVTGSSPDRLSVTHAVGRVDHSSVSYASQSHLNVQTAPFSLDTMRSVARAVSTTHMESLRLGDSSFLRFRRDAIPTEGTKGRLHGGQEYGSVRHLSRLCLS